jgi:hypothetical protein
MYTVCERLVDFLLGINQVSIADYFTLISQGNKDTYWKRKLILQIFIYVLYTFGVIVSNTTDFRMLYPISNGKVYETPSKFQHRYGLLGYCICV